MRRPDSGDGVEPLLSANNIGNGGVFTTAGKRPDSPAGVRRRTTDLPA
mgnify:FL=1